MQIVAKDIDVVSDVVTASDGVRVVVATYSEFRRETPAAASRATVNGRFATVCLKFEKNQWTWLLLQYGKLANDQERATAAFDSKPLPVKHKRCAVRSNSAHICFLTNIAWLGTTNRFAWTNVPILSRVCDFLFLKRRGFEQILCAS
jgi:hypothetical protein